MDASDRKRSLRAVVLLSAVYFLIAIAFGEFASRAASNSMRETWNRLAFLASGIAFAIHIGYEGVAQIVERPSDEASYRAINCEGTP
jgi:hypothetical protein